MPMTRKQLGEMIRQARIEKGLSLRKAADKLTIDPGYYSRIETGQNPIGKHARAIAKLYGLNVEELEAQASQKLPKFAPYLRAKYDLSDDAIAELEEHFQAVARRRTPKRGRS